MIRTNQYNNLSNESIPKLKPGETAVYRIIVDRPIRTPQDIPYHVQLPSSDVIYDNDKGEFVTIGYVTSSSGPDQANLGLITFHRRSGGAITLNGNKPEDARLFSYLELCNANKSNAKRRTDKKPIFFRVDEKADADGERRNRTKIREAMNAAAEMSAAEVREFVSAQNKDSSRDLSILRNELEKLAETAPEDFLKLTKDKNKKIKASIKRALDKKVLKFDSNTQSFSWGSTGEEIVRVPRTAGGGHLEGFVTFVLTQKNGDVVYEEIQKLLKG